MVSSQMCMIFVCVLARIPCPWAGTSGPEACPLSMPVLAQAAQLQQQLEERGRALLELQAHTASLERAVHETQLGHAQELAAAAQRHAEELRQASEVRQGHARAWAFLGLGERPGPGMLRSVTTVCLRASGCCTPASVLAAQVKDKEVQELRQAMAAQQAEAREASAKEAAHAAALQALEARQQQQQQRLAEAEAAAQLSASEGRGLQRAAQAGSEAATRAAVGEALRQARGEHEERLSNAVHAVWPCACHWGKGAGGGGAGLWFQALPGAALLRRQRTPTGRSIAHRLMRMAMPMTCMGACKPPESALCGAALAGACWAGERMPHQQQR